MWVAVMTFLRFWPVLRFMCTVGSISAVSQVRSLILPEERRLDAWPVDLVCDVIGKLIIQASSMSLEVKPVSNFLIYLAQNCIKRSLTHPNDFRNSFFGTFPCIVKNNLRHISVHSDMQLIFFDLRILVSSFVGPNWLILCDWLGSYAVCD